MREIDDIDPVRAVRYNHWKERQTDKMNSALSVEKQRNAFTMIELVLVIVVLGILSALAIPRMERDLRQEAADNILSAIRYTQHLALIDDKTDPFDTDWQKELWKISFSTSTVGNKAFFYTISSDSNHNGSVSEDETAIDPANGKYYFNTNGNPTINASESPNIFIGRKYGIKKMKFTGGCSDPHHIAFDHLGRPFNGIGGASNDFAAYMKRDCTITLEFISDGIDPLTIIIKKETGYAYIKGEPDS